jgi:hypothetical protein
MAIALTRVGAWREIEAAARVPRLLELARKVIGVLEQDADAQWLD